jgi:hypothetical protein
MTRAGHVVEEVGVMVPPLMMYQGCRPREGRRAKHIVIQGSDGKRGRGGPSPQFWVMRGGQGQGQRPLQRKPPPPSVSVRPSTTQRTCPVASLAMQMRRRRTKGAHGPRRMHRAMGS